MAETYRYTVGHGTHTRGDKDGSVTTYRKGETFEVADPEYATRHRNLIPLEPGGGVRLPEPKVEVQNATVGQAHEAADAKAKAQRARAGVTDPHAITERPDGGKAVPHLVPEPVKK